MSKENFDNDNKISLFKEILKFIENEVDTHADTMDWEVHKNREHKKTIDKHESFFKIERASAILKNRLNILLWGTDDEEKLKRLNNEYDDLLKYQYKEEQEIQEEVNKEVNDENDC